MNWTALITLASSVKISGCLFFIAAMLLAQTRTSAQPVVVVNPYEGIDWAAAQYKGNIHTHTTESDGSFDPARVIDMYREQGYSVLALTDHNTCTWPWEAYGRDPEATKMLAVPGNELSRHHHALSLFCDYETDSEDLDAALAGTAEAGGIAVLCHPAMHWERKHTDASRLRLMLDENARPNAVPEEEVQYYTDLFKRHAHLVATEVLNASEPLYRYPVDRQLWDRVLTALMPDRPVWGVNTDDMHSLDHFAKDFIMFPGAQLEMQAIRDALTDGAYYFSSRRIPESGTGHDGEPPRIVSIVHHDLEHAIEVRAEVNGNALPDEAYTWISDGKTVHTGPRLSYRVIEDLGVYARLEITAESGITFTNPFGFSAM